MPTLPLFPNGHTRPLATFNFVVIVGKIPIPFSKVSSLEISAETETYKEGGENRYVHSLSGAVSAEKMLLMERGTNSGISIGLLDSAAKTAANQILRVGMFFDFIIVAVLDVWGLPKKIYTVNHALLKKRRFSELDAMSGGVFVESLEFVYHELTEVPDVLGMFSNAQQMLNN